jgi:telomere length regulation protein
MSDLLTAVSTKKVNQPKPLIKEIQNLKIQDAIHISSAESALRALKSEPDRAIVTNVLKYLTTNGFSLLLPEPLNASIAHQLVNDTIPHYWRPLRESPQQKVFARILRNPTSIGHIITRLRSLIGDSQQKKAPGETRDYAEHIEDMLDVLEHILGPDQTSSLILRDVQTYGKNALQKKLLWKEYLAQIASGRIVSIAAEAQDVLRSSPSSRTASWLADGAVFASWLGRNIAILIKDDSRGEEQLTTVTELCSKTLNLGYTGQCVS